PDGQPEHGQPGQHEYPAGHVQVEPAQVGAYRERQDRAERDQKDAAPDTHTARLTVVDLARSVSRQKTSSGRSMSSSVVDSMIRRSEPIRGSTSCAKNRAAATLPS